MITSTDTLDIILTTGQIYHITKDPAGIYRHILGGINYIRVQTTNTEEVYINTAHISEMRVIKKGVA